MYLYLGKLSRSSKALNLVEDAVVDPGVDARTGPVLVLDGTAPLPCSAWLNIYESSFCSSLQHALAEISIEN